MHAIEINIYSNTHLSMIKIKFILLETMQLELEQNNKMNYNFTIQRTYS
jgi:hypothetical protein